MGEMQSSYEPSSYAVTAYDLQGIIHRLSVLEARNAALESRLDYLSKLVVADIGERPPVDALALPERIADGEQIEETYSRWRNGQKP